ncbi:aldo/keto reductase [candidate division KSB1 bacterium]|nr:aldo/keto reductase [candidate division KSB1 bacterium]RQW01988.1 MAG: aldo/keto reductase [candidate division KSB1 bacterium]
MPRRILGRTGEKLSMLGFGGVLVMNEEQKIVNEMVAKAYDHGINYFDVAPSYGNAEDLLGPAFAPYRDRCFFACKTTERTAEGAQRELEESLKKLRTDHFDLYQLHALTTLEDVEAAFAPKGAMETFLQAQKEGKIRYIGFSAHSELAALSAMDRYDFDTILFPINFAAWYKGNFGPRVVAKAKETNKGILALKGLAYRRYQEGEDKLYPKAWYVPIDINDTELAQKALSWIYAQGVTAAIPPGEPLFWDRAFRIAATASELGPGDIEQLQNEASGIATPIFPEARV